MHSICEKYSIDANHPIFLLYFYPVTASHTIYTYLVVAAADFTAVSAYTVLYSCFSMTSGKNAIYMNMRLYIMVRETRVCVCVYLRLCTHWIDSIITKIQHHSSYTRIHMHTVSTGYVAIARTVNRLFFVVFRLEWMNQIYFSIEKIAKTVHWSAHIWCFCVVSHHEHPVTIEWDM